MLRTFGVGVTVFGCGWVLMGLEIVGGRMLSPDFGSGVWVWGSVISVFLAALGIGYFAGGLLSQRFPYVFGLALVIITAAISIVPVAIWYRQISGWFVSFDLHERWGSLLATTSLFFIPIMLLGIVSPFAIRLVTKDLASVGTKAGILYAISTLGSFFGCLLTSFYFILWMGIRQILFLSAGALFIIALLLSVTWYARGSEKKETVTDGT
ncbi:MAG: fused MFS/spermidine synthase [Sedimentisphaerales bacterium]|nr:fused MFS/spermidine synthase [Sedimentisphaerales bacterium]